MEQTESVEARYDRLSEEFFDIYYTYHPVHATRQGLHQYDNSLGHYRRDEIEETLRRMKAVQAQVAEIDPASMDRLHALDHPVLTTRLKREIYWVETWRFWENNPLFYKDIITEGLFNLVSRSFAPLEARLQCVIDRERDVPAVLQAARDNLVNPPAVYTEQAIRYMQGARLFFTEIPKVFEAVADPALRREFEQANQTVLDELERFVVFLQDDLLPRSHGNFAVGEAGIQAILDAEEMIEVPVEKILERLYHDLEQADADLARPGPRDRPRSERRRYGETSAGQPSHPREPDARGAAHAGGAARQSDRIRAADGAAGAAGGHRDQNAVLRRGGRHDAHPGTVRDGGQGSVHGDQPAPARLERGAA